MNDAVAALNKAISHNPRSSSYYYVLAGVYRQLGWTDDSRKALEEFKRLDQESAELEKKRRSVADEAAPRRRGGSVTSWSSAPASRRGFLQLARRFARRRGRPGLAVSASAAPPAAAAGPWHLHGRDRGRRPVARP